MPQNSSAKILRCNLNGGHLTAPGFKRLWPMLQVGVWHQLRGCYWTRHDWVVVRICPSIFFSNLKWILKMLNLQMISSQGFYPARVLGISNQKKSQNTSSLVTWLMVRNQETPRLHVHQYLWSEVGPYPTWHHRKPHTASPKFRRLPQDSAPTWDVSSAVAGWCVGHTVFHVWWPLETYKHMKHINLAWHLETRLASEVSGPFPTSSKAVSSCCEISVSFEDLVRRESQNRTNLSYSCWFQGFYSMKVLRLERLKKIFLSWKPWI